MSYQSYGLSVLTYANGFTFWHYASPDTPAAVTASGYFNPACDMLRAGDMIVASLGTGDAVRSGFLSVIESRHDGVTIVETVPPGGSL